MMSLSQSEEMRHASSNVIRTPAIPRKTYGFAIWSCPVILARIPLRFLLAMVYLRLAAMVTLPSICLLSFCSNGQVVKLR
jgi:hypothetical protein